MDITIGMDGSTIGVRNVLEEYYMREGMEDLWDVVNRVNLRVYEASGGRMFWVRSRVDRNSAREVMDVRVQVMYGDFVTKDGDVVVESRVTIHDSNAVVLGRWWKRLSGDVILEICIAGFSKAVEITERIKMRS